MNTNALIHEKSPYLRQHAHNPVDWLAWGEDAFEKARSENKPIFLSIGYSTCHWCHVMAHESFENEGIAAILNRDFVPIKIDREERPDVDRIYMLFVQASSGSGGWPMSVWLTPELKPFYGGTYFPPSSRYGRPGFLELLQHLGNAWKGERARIESSSTDVLDQLRAMTATSRVAQDADRFLFEAGYGQFRKSFDARWGGFGTAPKFPRPVVLNYLLRYFADSNETDALEMVTETLGQMAKGGMHDQLGGGFHRYSVDDHWFVPHFEKMLYDQAQLAISYLEAFQATRDERLANVARDIFGYVLRDMTDASGAFFSAEDADSPDPDNPSHSREGAFYVWKEGEIEAMLAPADAALFCVRYGVEAGGNVEEDPHVEFSGQNILYQARSTEEVARRAGISAEQAARSLLDSSRKVLDVRAKRPRPHLDNKVLTSWNALLISALAKGFTVLFDNTLLAAAERAASFLLSTMYDRESGKVLRRFCEGEAGIPGFLDDYSFFAQAMLDLFEASGKALYLGIAVEVARRGFAWFADTADGGFFSTAAESPDLLLRIKDDYDGAEPSGNSVATDVLLRLAHLTGDDQARAAADRSLRSFAPRMKAQPTIAPQMLAAVGRSLAEPEQIVIRCLDGSVEVDELAASYRQKFSPWSTVLVLTDEAADSLSSVAPFLASLGRKGRITTYECRNFTCQLPRVIE